MWKRIVFLVLVLLTLTALLPAQAEGQPEALYRIVQRTEEGDETLGTGVLFSTGRVLLTVKSCWAEGDLYAIGRDGEHAINYRGEIVGTQLMTLGLATESAAQPLVVTAAQALDSLMLYGAAADGSFVSLPVTLSRTTVIDGRRETLLSAGEGLLPGAIMLGEDGGIACITVAQQGEGEGVYAAIANVTLSGLVPEEKKPEPGLVQDFSVTVERGRITVDWTEVADWYAEMENPVFRAYVTATCNPYLSYSEPEDGGTSVDFPAIPGTEVAVWVAVSEGEPEDVVFPESAEEMRMVTVPQAGSIDLYGMRNLRCGLAVGVPGLDGDAADFLPACPLNRAALLEGGLNVYFQTEDVYEVAQRDDDHALLIALHTPEGYVFCYSSGYVFMPELQGSDLWIADITEIFSSYEQFVDEAERWPAGEYAVAYYVDGCEVGRIPFVLE